MLKNYFKIAWRNIMKNKTFSFINVFGLAIGLTCCMLISLYINYETSYDNYHRHAQQLYQLGTIFLKDGKAEKTANTPAPMASTMKQEFPEIMETTRIMGLFSEDKTLLQYQPENGSARSFYERKAIWPIQHSFGCSTTILLREMLHRAWISRIR